MREIVFGILQLSAANTPLQNIVTSVGTALKIQKPGHLIKFRRWGGGRKRKNKPCNLYCNSEITQITIRDIRYRNNNDNNNNNNEI